MIDYGNKTYLAPLDLTYSHTLFRWRNDYQIRRYCRQNDLLTLGSHTEWMKSVEFSPKNKMYFVTRKTDRNIMGVCGLTNLDLLNRNAEFSLYIGPEYQNQGYGKEALKTLVSHGFNAYGLHSIWGETFDFNPASYMFEKIGFKKEGVRRGFYFREGLFIDAFLYSITKSDWVVDPNYNGLRDEKCSS